MASKFKKNDTVKVMTGSEKGKISQITKVYPKSSKVLLSGINLVKKHTKPHKANPEGGILQKEMPIHISNISHVDSKSKITTKIGFKILNNGKKIRFYKKSGEFLSNK